ncbi:MAG TPA: VOC family protein [Acidobacteriaceae bacterium]|nr:VOC family protein [Acidobacteriaceae bacterium]
MVRLTPYLLFNGNCAEAMTFYQNCFGGELMLVRLGDTPMKDSVAPEHHHKITYALLKSGTVEFSATDWLHPTRAPVQGNTTAIYVSGNQPDELKAIFSKLSHGAGRENLVDLKEMPFGLFGRLTDRYGVEWFFRGEKAGD